MVAPNDSLGQVLVFHGHHLIDANPGLLGHAFGLPPLPAFLIRFFVHARFLSASSRSSPDADSFNLPLCQLKQPPAGLSCLHDRAVQGCRASDRSLDFDRSLGCNTSLDRCPHVRAGENREAGEIPARGRRCIRREVRARFHCDSHRGKVARDSLPAVSQKTCPSRCCSDASAASIRASPARRASSARGGHRMGRSGPHYARPGGKACAHEPLRLHSSLAFSYQPQRQD